MPALPRSMNAYGDAQTTSASLRSRALCRTDVMPGRSATLVGVKASRITKIAGLSLAGFAASIVADKVNLNPLPSQITGFVGAFFGTLVGRRRASRRIMPAKASPDETVTPIPPAKNEPD